jgi:hypothetical protein
MHWFAKMAMSNIMSRWTQCLEKHCLEGCCLLCVMSHAIWTYQEIALEGEQQNVDFGVEYEELRCHTNVENQSRFNSLFGVTWK